MSKLIQSIGTSQIEEKPTAGPNNWVHHIGIVSGLFSPQYKIR